MTEYLDKKSSFISVYFFIGITIFFSFFLEIFVSNLLKLSVHIPLTLMVLIYWNMALPKNIGLIWSMIFGFCLDINQEIYYPPIMQALLDIGYDGFVGQEFIPTRDPVMGLTEAIELCDV